MGALWLVAAVLVVAAAAFTAEQINPLDPPQRFFNMDAIMKGLPVDVLHIFDRTGASMRVKVVSVFSMADVKGPDLTRAETVTTHDGEP
jgi:hypothetical protein